MVEMIDFIQETVDIFNTHQYIENIMNIINMGSSADRQIQVFRASASPKDVVDTLIKETAIGL